MSATQPNPYQHPTLQMSVTPEQRERAVSWLQQAYAEDRIGETVRVLVEDVDEETGDAVGRAEHQGPDVDGTTRVVGATAGPGETLLATVVGTEGIDLVADPT